MASLEPGKELQGTATLVSQHKCCKKTPNQNQNPKPKNLKPNQVKQDQDRTTMKAGSLVILAVSDMVEKKTEFGGMRDDKD